MDPIIFCSESGQHYLYSPNRKSIIPISSDIARDLEIGEVLKHPVSIQLKRNGYLDKYQEVFSKKIEVSDIEYALRELSQLVFETTTSCNLRCSYCCYGDGYTTFDSRKMEHGNLSFSTAKAVIDLVCDVLGTNPYWDNTPFSISFYGGEPLLNFKIVKEIVEYAEHKNFGNRNLKFTMTTNATKLFEYADFLCEHKFNMLISLDGNEKHNAYRKTSSGKESFQLVLNNIEKTTIKYPEWASSFRFNCVFTNLSNLEEIVGWYKEKFNKVPNISPLREPSKGSKEYTSIVSMLGKYDVPSSLEFSEDLVSQNPFFSQILGMTYHLLGNVLQNESCLGSKMADRAPTGTCIPFSKRLFVDYAGRIHPCEKVSRSNPLGFVDCHNKCILDLKKTAKVFNDSMDSVKEKCRVCYRQQFCTQCVMCFDEYGCTRFLNKNQMSELLVKVVSYLENHPSIISFLEDKIITI